MMTEKTLLNRIANDRLPKLLLRDKAKEYGNLRVGRLLKRWL
jgi:hypothetical protein